MENKVKITGLDCPNCAKALENKINGLECVEQARIDFLNSELTYTSANIDKSFNKIKQLTKQMFPDVVLTRQDDNTTNTKKNLIIDVAVLSLGILLGLVVLFIKMPIWLFWCLYVTSALIIGYKTYVKAIKLIVKGVINENLLVTLSIIGATAVGEHMEGLMVIALYTIGKILEGIAVNKSRNSIKELTNLKPEYAVVINGEKEEKVLPSTVNVGDIILVKPGERVPLDGVIIEGSATLNNQSLTGESLPVAVNESDEILSGAIVLDGVLKIKVTSLYKNSI